MKPLGLGHEKAIETIRTWRFKPAMRNGVPVNVRMLVEVSFFPLFGTLSPFATALSSASCSEHVQIARFVPDVKGNPTHWNEASAGQLI